MSMRAGTLSVVTLLGHLVPPGLRWLDMLDDTPSSAQRGRELGSGLEAGWPNTISSCAGATKFLGLGLDELNLCCYSVDAIESCNGNAIVAWKIHDKFHEDSRKLDFALPC